MTGCMRAEWDGRSIGLWLAELGFSFRGQLTNSDIWESLRQDLSFPVFRVQLGGSLSHLDLECLDILPGKLEEVENGLDHPTDTAVPSTWTWIAEEREMWGKYHCHSVHQSVIRATDCHDPVHYTWAVGGVKKQVYDEAFVFVITLTIPHIQREAIIYYIFKAL